MDDLLDNSFVNESFDYHSSEKNVKLYLSSLQPTLLLLFSRKNNLLFHHGLCFIPAPTMQLKRIFYFQHEQSIETDLQLAASLLQMT
jgi:hypothetical protein